MEDDIDTRRTRYKQMSTQELLELHAVGILGDMAHKLLESELRERGATIPSRPRGDETLTEIDSTENHKVKGPRQFLMLAWISPLIGLTLLLVLFVVEGFSDSVIISIGFMVGEKPSEGSWILLITAILLFLLSITIGAILTAGAFVERKRYSNALIHGVIGLFVNVIFIILITAFGLYLSLWKVIPLK